jgi:hypothetical protein
LAQLAEVSDETADFLPAESFAPPGHMVTLVQNCAAGMYAVKEGVIGPPRHITCIRVRSWFARQISGIEAISIAVRSMAGSAVLGVRGMSIGGMRREIGKWQV